MEVPVLNSEAEAVAVVVILVVEADGSAKVVTSTHGPPAVVAVLTLSER